MSLSLRFMNGINRKRPLVTVFAFLGLSACTVSGPEITSTNKENVVSATAPAAPVRPSSSSPAQTSSSSDAPSAEDKRRQQELAAVTGDPDQFLDMEPKSLAAALGAPRQIRRDGTAEVWQFLGKGCTIDIFLYPGEAGGSPRVKFVDLRGDGLTTAGRQDCLAALRREQIVRSS